MFKSCQLKCRYDFKWAECIEYLNAEIRWRQQQCLKINVTAVPYVFRYAVLKCDSDDSKPRCLEVAGLVVFRIVHGWWPALFWCLCGWAATPRAHFISLFGARTAEMEVFSIELAKTEMLEYILMVKLLFTHVGQFDYGFSTQEMMFSR
jgi:hypothetical protein